MFVIFISLYVFLETQKESFIHLFIQKNLPLFHFNQQVNRYYTNEISNYLKKVIHVNFRNRNKV